MNSKAVWVCVAVGLIAVTMLAGFRPGSSRSSQEAIPIRVGGDDVPDILVYGKPEETERRLRVLYQDLKRADFPRQPMLTLGEDTLKLLAGIPDKAMAESKSDRHPQTIPVVLHREPYAGEVLAWTPLYVRSNLEIYSGDRTVRREPKGFYLALYRDGAVRRVPANAARWTKGVSRGQTVNQLLLPGMVGYDAAPEGALYPIGTNSPPPIDRA